MRRPPLCVCLCLLAVTAARPAAAQVSPSKPGQAPDKPVSQARVDRLERWLKAAARHEPGEIDAELQEISSWSQESLRELWVDAGVLAQLTRTKHIGGRFYIRNEGEKESTEVRYAPPQAKRMSVLSCAADGGAFYDVRCKKLGALDDLDSELRQIAFLANAAYGRGDPNYALRRGALLHADVAMLASSSIMSAPYEAKPSSGPQSLRMEISDGQELGIHQWAVHWQIARTLLDYVVPKGYDRAAPEHDPMVRAWYRATAAWMQLSEDHVEDHLMRALKIFPDDPDLLFLAGSQRETFAGAAIQAAVRSAVLPSGVTMSVYSPQTELREAERFFRRVLQVKPDHAEARLRFGRVLGTLGKHAEAAIELRRAASGLTDEEQLYFAELFLGAEEEALGNREPARLTYERAAARCPRAQSPLIALSQLAWRTGDRNAALKAMDRVFALAGEERRDQDDPWWDYYVVQARNADDLLAALREPYLQERLP